MIPINLSSFIANLSSPKYDPSYPLGDRGTAGTWQIAAPYRVGQKLTMKAAWPRPDNETDANSYLRNAHPNIEYAMPVCIQGGERPLRYEIIAAPAGATITGEMQRTTDPVTGLILHSRQKELGLVKWTPTSGTQTFTVRVTDQSGATLDVTWTVLVDASKFVIVDSSVGSSGSGTWASPLKTWADLWGNDSTATYANKIAYFKPGTYNVQSVGGGHCSVNTNVKPLAYIGPETGGVTFNNTAGHFYVNRGDFAVRNIIFDGCVASEGNVRIFQISVKASNYLFDGNTFINNSSGTVKNDNPACVIFMGNGMQYGVNDPYSFNIAYINNTFPQSCKLEAYNNFDCDTVLVENNNLDMNLVLGGNGTIGIHIKDDTRNVTVAFNTVRGVYNEGMIRVSNQQNRVNGSYNQEVCYNYCITLIDVSSAMSWNQNVTESLPIKNPENAHAYRNTIKTAAQDAFAFRDWNGAGSDFWVRTTGNAYFAGSFEDGGAYVAVGAPSRSFTDAQIDSSNGALTTNGNARATYLGTVGWEIAST